MINLLPPEVKESIVYARRNTRLRHFATALLLSVVGIAGVVGAGELFLQQSIHSYANQVNVGNEALKAEKLDETQKEVQSLTDSLKLVAQVLQREILFSKLLSQIGAALPNGSILTDLSINKLQGGIDLKAAATDYQTATQVQLNLQDANNKIFEKADIVSIQCTPVAANSTDPLKTKYPCSVQLRALFSKNNSFSLITPTAGSTKP